MLFALWCFLVALAGGLVGLVLGNLRLPATLVVASSAAAGTGANLLISAVAAADGAAIAHIRAGRINWRLFAWMAPPSVVGAMVGGYLSGVLPQRRAARPSSPPSCSTASYRAARAGRRRSPRPTTTRPDARRAARRSRTGARHRVARRRRRADPRLAADARAAAAASASVPARAAGTNVTVGFCVGVAGAHRPPALDAAPDWTDRRRRRRASIPGALLGSRLTGRLSEAAARSGPSPSCCWSPRSRLPSVPGRSLTWRATSSEETTEVFSA